MEATQVQVRPLPTHSILKVAGVSYRQDVVRTVVEADRVLIEHDPTNPYDAFACKVLTADGRQLGFIPTNQAHRLAGATPGGVWSGRIENVYRNDTWGLRLSLGELIERRSTDMGQRIGGLSHRSDGLVMTDEGAVAVLDVSEDPAADQPEEDTPPVPVYAKSGRALGTLLEVVGSRVRVLTEAGTKALYPAAVVRFDS